MQIIRLRTKIEILGAIVLIGMIVALSVAAITRTITDSSDSSYRYIRNSNGKFWDVSESNIQAAINDLGESGWKNGVVWVPGNREIIINQGIVLNKYVTLDLGGSYLDVRSNVDCITMAEGSTLRGGTIDTRNYAGTYTKAAIVFNPSAVGHNYWTGKVRVENMYLQGAESEGAGIEYRMSNQGNIAAFTSCTNIQVYQFKYGILISVLGGSTSGVTTYANSNTFNNIQMIRPVYGIYLDRNTALTYNQCTCDGNIFSDIIIQTGSITRRAIYAEGRYNIYDNILVWDWEVASGTYCYEFSADAQNQYLKFFGGANFYQDNGVNNYRVNMALNEQSIVQYTQSWEPDIPTNTMAFWRNTSSGKYYIIQDFNGVQKKAELT